MADAGRIVIIPKGEYKSNITYERLDAVEYNSNGYIALKTVTGITPTNDGTNWALYVKGTPADSELSTTSMNPVQNKVITQALQEKANTDNVDALNRTVTELQENKADKTEVREDISSINRNLTSEISRAKGAEETLKSRIDTITSLPEGSTTGDAELQDIRVKADGTTSTSAGNAVREQFSELKGDLGDLEDDIYDKEYKRVTDFTPNYNNYYYINNLEWLSNEYQHSIIVNCQSGDVFHTTGSVNADVIAPVVYFDENDNYVGNVGLGTSGNYDLEIEIPNNVTKVVFQNTGDAPTPTKLYKTLKITMSKIKPLVVWKSGSAYFIRCKYNSVKDAIYGFAKNENDNFNLFRIFLVDNTGEFVKVSTDGMSAETQFFALSSEWLSPYSDMKAKHNIDGDYTEGWTGGSHKINGLQTMENLALNVFADKNNVTDKTDITLCNEVKFCVLNSVYACNTLKNSGNSRGVITEYIVYTVTPNKISVDVEIKVLEDISIANYYGLQQELSPWNAEMVVIGSKLNTKGIDISTASNINFDTINGYNCSKWELRKGGHNSICELDVNYGIGDRRYLNNDTPTAHLHDWGKMYSYLIKDKEFEYGDILKYRGSYDFFSNN